MGIAPRRQLGLFDATMIVMGGIVGSGIFINPYVVARHVHTPFLILGVWLAGGALAMLGAFIWAELATRLPGAGGNYLYLRVAYHPSVAFIYGWVLLLVTQTGGMAAVAVTFARYFREISGCQWGDGAIAATTLLTLTAVNCLGVRWGSNVQSALMILKSAAIAGMVVLGLVLGGGHIHPLPLLDQPVSFGLLAAIGAAMTPVAFAYGGWQTASFVAEEMHDSRRDLSRGLLLGVSGVIVLYLSANFVCLKVLGPDGLAATPTPASAVMRAALGEQGALWIAVGIAVSTLGFLSQSILTAPRVYYAMARDGLFFAKLAQLSPRTAVPTFAIIAQGLAATATALIGKYEKILNYEVAVDFILFALVATSLFVFRSREHGVVPAGVHRVPGHPYTTALFVIACVAIVGSTVWSDPFNSAIGWLILLTGIPVYLYWSRRRGKESMTHKHSDYMHWAKTGSKAPFNLATSGVGSFPLRGLPFDLAALEINGPNSYGYPPLKEAIGAQYSFDPEGVVTAEGTSMANYLAMATILEAGDEVVIEHPAYGLLVDAALTLGAQVKRFARREENSYAVDPVEVRRAVTPKTRLIVLTNLHNPSSVLTPDFVLREVADIARSVGAKLLVDEVYLDAVYQNKPATAALIGPDVLVTSSLTKVYGLSGLRCGWVLAEPELARSMYAMKNVMGSIGVHPGELLSVAAFHNLPAIRDRARQVVEADRAALTEFLDANGGVSALRTPWGTTSFMRLHSGDTAAFLDRLRTQYETTAVPGSFFDMPDHFRIGMGVDAAMFREGLRRIALALAD